MSRACSVTESRAVSLTPHLSAPRLRNEHLLSLPHGPPLEPRASSSGHDPSSRAHASVSHLFPGSCCISLLPLRKERRGWVGDGRSRLSLALLGASLGPPSSAVSKARFTKGRLPPEHTGNQQPSDCKAKTVQSCPCCSVVPLHHRIPRRAPGTECFISQLPHPHPRSVGQGSHHLQGQQ